MNTVKMIFLASGLAFALNAAAATDVSGNPALELAPGGEVISVGADWGAKENCKSLGGKWKPIRRICKLTTINTPGL